MTRRLFSTALAAIFLTGCSTSKNTSVASGTQQASGKQANRRAPQNVNVKDLTNTFVVQYDYTTGLYDINNIKPKVDNPVVYRIDSINRYSYKIQVKIRDSVLAGSFSLTDLPDVFKKAEQQPDKAEEDIPQPSADKIENSDISDKTEKGKTDDQLIETLNRLLKAPAYSTEIEKNTENLGFLRIEVQKIQPIILTSISDTAYKEEIASKIKNYEKIKDDPRLVAVNDDVNQYNSIAEQIDDYKMKSLKLENELNNINKEKIHYEQYISDMKTLTEIFYKIKKNYRSANKVTQHGNLLYEILNDPHLCSKEQYTKLHFKTCAEMEKEFDSLKADVLQFRTSYHDFSLQYEQLKRNYQLNSLLKEAGTNKLYEFADNLKKRVENMNSKIKADELLNEINKMRIIIKTLENDDTYKWVSAPFVPTGDVVIFDVDIKKKERNGEDIRNDRKFSHPEFTYGGIRFDFGLGLAASYFDHTPVYELSASSSPTETAEQGSVIRINQKSNNLTVPSLVGMATLSHRSSHYITYGASAGLGIDVVNGKIQLSNFFAGPSIIFGRYERLTFTAGASLRNVGRLRTGIEEGKPVTGSTKLEDYITDKYKIGAFMALTFNLTQGVKQNIKSVRSLL